MTEPLDLRTLAVGERLQHPLLVRAVEHKESKGGNPYLVLTLGNASGELRAKVWPEKLHLVAGVAPGHVLQVIGTIGEYQGTREINADSLRVLPKGSVELRALVPSVGDPEPFWRRLDEWRAAVAAPGLRAALDLFYADDAFRARYEQCPASTGGHHAQLGGLLKHTWEIAHIGRAMATALGADKDLVLAGALLHDIGKLESYRWDTGAFETTDAGRVLGHVALGALMLERRLVQPDAPPLAEPERHLLQHFIFSHHGKLEFGAIVPPMTLEAVILHFADDASAKGASMADALDDPGAFAEGSAVSQRTFWQLDRARAWQTGALRFGAPP